MNWNDVLQLADNNPAPPHVLKKPMRNGSNCCTPEQYRVTRQHGTEKPFSGEFCEIYTPGIYKCVCCGTELSLTPPGNFALPAPAGRLTARLTGECNEVPVRQKLWYAKDRSIMQCL